MFIVSSQSDEPQLFTQAELNDLVKELDLPKSSAELLGSRLKEKNLLAPETKVSFYGYREKGRIEFFKMEENFCDNIGHSPHLKMLGHFHSAENC